MDYWGLSEELQKTVQKEDETGKKVVKILFALILVSQILLGIDAISDVIEEENRIRDNQNEQNKNCKKNDEYTSEYPGGGSV